MVEIEDEVAPQETAEESESLIDISEIMEASGISKNSFIDNASEPEEVAEESETETETEGENVPAEAEIEDSEESVKSDDSGGVKKRIGKLVEAKNNALAEVEELRAELEGLKDKPVKTQKVETKGLDKFKSVKTMEELKDREESAEHLREWLLENPDGGDYKDLTGADHDVDYDQARQLMVETDRDLRKNIPKVANRLIEKQKQTNIAMQTFGWMSDQASPESKEVNAILANNPLLVEYVSTDPHGLITIGYAVEGFKAQRAAQAKKAGGKQPTAPNVPTAPSRSKPNVVKSKTQTTESLLKKAASGDVDDAASYIESIL
jgi:hypothetical protein